MEELQRKAAELHRQRYKDQVGEAAPHDHTTTHYEGAKGDQPPDARYGWTVKQQAQRLARTVETLKNKNPI